jgi:hypothetical protein
MQQKMVRVMLPTARSYNTANAAEAEPLAFRQPFANTRWLLQPTTQLMVKT